MATDLLLTALRQHLQLYPTDKVILEPLQNGASGRSIARLKPEGHPTFIGLHYTEERQDNAHFVPLARFLGKVGLNVPGIMYENYAKGVAIMQDLGDQHLLDIKDQPWEEREPYYRSVFEQLDRLLYTRVPKDVEFMPPFTAETYQWEQDYFIEHFVEKHLNLNGDELRANAPLKSLRERLGASQRHLVHRDLQSQNILLKDGKAWLLDFQGMRLGYQEYDLASLIYDPYMAHSLEDQEKLINLWEDITEERPLPQLMRDCATQRLMQALGAYGNIVHNYKKDWYLEHIPTASKSLLQVIQGSELESALSPILEKSLSQEGATA